MYEGMKHVEKRSRTFSLHTEFKEKKSSIVEGAWFEQHHQEEEESDRCDNT